MCKKLLVMLLVMSMVFTMIPFGVSAAEEKDTNRISIVEKAASAFPEYADKLMNPSHSSTYTRSAADRVLITKETRPISDTESITYAEYSDGVILLSSYDEPFRYETTQTTYPGDVIKRVVMDVEAAYVWNGTTLGTFYLNDVTYVCDYGLNDFDYFVSAGTATKGYGCSYANRTTYRQYEDYEHYATIIYDLSFKVTPNDGDYVQSRLSLYVGEDMILIDHEER